MQTKHLEDCVLVLIAVLMVAICVYTPNDTNNIPFDKGLTPYEQFPDAYENSSFNPANGYVKNSDEILNFSIVFSDFIMCNNKII